LRTYVGRSRRSSRTLDAANLGRRPKQLRSEFL